MGLGQSRTGVGWSSWALMDVLAMYLQLKHCQFTIGTSYRVTWPIYFYRIIDLAVNSHIRVTPRANIELQGNSAGIKF